LKLETTVPPLAVPGDWQGPQTADHWWCVGCGMWERCDDHDVCERCVRRTQQSDAGKAAATLSATIDQPRVTQQTAPAATGTISHSTVSDPVG
jgi:hypothetical protein